ncbi:MAG: acetolactate synthase large subunit [Gammaproteobacteria bacterium]|nr:acetolactate synthase large subunit [Gammaproteobacteria bacterium]
MENSTHPNPRERRMNGAESLVRTLVNHGVTQCFANPGTSEMHLVQAIDRVREFNTSLCLFEGVCTGAADGYGRMSGVPAVTLLHLGAGLGNGIANLHNCRRAGTPLINIIGDHAIHHAAYDAPLTSDVEAVAKPVSSWIRSSRTSNGVGLDAADATHAAMANHPDPNGNVATLIVPTDCAWGDGVERPQMRSFVERAKIDNQVIDTVAPQIDAYTVLLLDGNALTEDGLKTAGRIAAKTQCSLFTPTFPARVEAGPQLPSVNRLPYFPEHVLATLSSCSKLVLAGGDVPVSFFAYRDQPSSLVPEGCDVVHLAHRHEDVADALVHIAERINAEKFLAIDGDRPDLPQGRLGARSIAQALAALAPHDCIVSVDSGGGGAAYDVLRGCVRHSWLNLTGGSIGDGGPVAVGAALACPERTVFALLGDGGAMYTLQYLWTAARDNLNIKTVVFSNRQYNILEVEYLRMGVNQVGDRAAALFDLNEPALDWLALAKGQGVPGKKATTSEEFSVALECALASDGPYLIEAEI